MNGFYVPGSVSGSYVANKRDEEGGLLYESAANQVGIQKQAAIQQLEKNYAQTVENAYASYLAANRGVQGSQMGQGYKELYKQLQQQQLQQNIASTTGDFRQQVMNIEAQEASAQQQIQQQFQQEVSYFDRLQQSMSNYFDYVKSLTDTNGNGYFDPYELNQSVDSMYDILSQAQPIGSFDAEGNQIGYADQEGKAGMTYSEWIAKQMGTSSEDQAWYQWFVSGGFNEFMNAPKSTQQWQPGELKQIREEELRIKEEMEKRPDVGKVIVTTPAFSGDIKVTIDGKEYSVKTDKTASSEIDKKYGIGGIKLSNPGFKYGDVVMHNNKYYVYVGKDNGDVKYSNTGRFVEIKDFTGKKSSGISKSMLV